MSENKFRPLISVVIPTFNRAKYLEFALKSLTDQTIGKNEFEVIVINDGSNDNTVELCNKFIGRLNLKCFTIENSGISSAKNLGLFASSSPICFFFDDDDVAHKNLLKEHIISHNKYPEENVAILGYTTWSSKIPVSYLMHYITDIGCNLFYYRGFQNEKLLDYTFFWGGRCSCKRSFLIKNGAFNQGFKFGSEDIELGYRLNKFGLKVIYNANAQSYMVRTLTFEQFCKRCEKQGKSLDHFLRLHPTEEIERYAGVQQAQSKWDFAKEFLEENVKRINVLEKKIIHPLNAVDSKSIKDELNKLYSWVFEVYKIKGYLEEYNFQQKLNNRKDENYIMNYHKKDVEYITHKQFKGYSPNTRKKNILVIDPLLPMYDRASGSLRLFQVLRSLLELDYHITYVAQNDTYKEQYAPLLQEMGIEVYTGDARAMYLNGNNRISPQLDIKKIITCKKYSHALMSFWYIGENYLHDIRKYSPETKIIVDSVDIHFVRELREAALKNDSLEQKRALDKKGKELKTYSSADEVWVITEYDKKVLEDNGITNPIRIVPNIHDKINETKIYEQTKDLLFVGNFWHTPNIDAVKFLQKEVFPKVVTEIPDVKLYIVGNNPTDEIKKMQSENITVTGFVEDITPYLRQSRISVAPLRFGAGMKGKIGEALSWGLPVVTTSIGAEGMNLINYETAVISDDPIELANAIIKIYQDKTLWEILSHNGKQHVEENWSYNAILNKIKDIFSPNVKTSIITLTYNGVEYTKKFYESLLPSGSNEYELIIIDNASTDGTEKYLEEISLLNEKIKVIKNNVNLGFPSAVNQGIKEAKGKYIIIVNNDIVLTEGWLERMIEVAESDSKIGLVGPISNEVSGLQIDENAKYKTIDEMHKYAANVAIKNKGEILNFPRIAFLCTLIKKGVIDKIGGLDERFSPGNYEDDDFCLRAQLARFKTVIAKDVFIHHFGSKSFKANGLKAYGERLEINRKIFVDKWGVTPDELWLKNKPIKGHGIIYPIDKNLFKQYFERTKVQLADNELELAKESIQKAVEHFSEGDEVVIAYDQLCNIAGNIYLASGEIEQAKGYFEHELNANPTSSSSCKGLGDVFLAQENYEAAKTMYEWAIKNDPNSVSAVEALSVVNKELGLEPVHNSLEAESS